jgi:hypothetical protein
MATNIFFISKKLGLEAKAVLAKAKELGIVTAKVVSSPLDDLTAEWLEEAILKSPPVFVEGSGAYETKDASRVHEADFSIPQRMKPSLRGDRLIEVSATISWNSTLKHRIYSCPDTSEFDSVLGASAMILRNKCTRVRIPLDVCAVTRLPANRHDCLSKLESPFRDRAEKFLAEMADDPRIIYPGCAHRLYFLDTEPWPPRMQELTTITSATEWSAILSICTESYRFFRWPQKEKVELLWPGCIRTESDGEHKYSPQLVVRLETMGLKTDTRTNGPAIVSFLAAGGERPRCNGEGWHIHHVFDGTEGSPHAVSNGDLFTHSAGLVAAHPAAHHLAHQSGLLKWLLRREAFLRFGFDPKGDFVIA